MRGRDGEGEKGGGREGERGRGAEGEKVEGDRVRELIKKTFNSNFLAMKFTTQHVLY